MILLHTFVCNKINMATTQRKQMNYKKFKMSCEETLPYEKKKLIYVVQQIGPILFKEYDPNTFPYGNDTAVECVKFGAMLLLLKELFSEYKSDFANFIFSLALGRLNDM